MVKLPAGTTTISGQPEQSLNVSPMRSDESEDARTFAKRIEARVSELAEEFSSGWWEARKKAYAGAVQELSGPEAGAWRRRWALGPKPGSKPNKSTWP